MAKRLSTYVLVTLAALLMIPAARVNGSDREVSRGTARVTVTVEVTSSLSVSSDGGAQSAHPVTLWIGAGGRVITYSVIDG